MATRQAILPVRGDWYNGRSKKLGMMLTGGDFAADQAGRGRIKDLKNSASVVCTSGKPGYESERFALKLPGQWAHCRKLAVNGITGTTKRRFERLFDGRVITGR